MAQSQLQLCAAYSSHIRSEGFSILNRIGAHTEGGHRREQQRQIGGRLTLLGRLSYVERAAKSLRDLRIAEVAQLDMVIEEGKVTAYCAKLKVSFKYEGGG